MYVNALNLDVNINHIDQTHIVKIHTVSTCQVTE